MKNVLHKIFAIAMLLALIIPEIGMPITTHAQAQGSVISRAATRTARIAAAKAKLALAIVNLKLATDALLIPPAPLTGFVADMGLRTQNVVAAKAALEVAAKEFTDANTSVAEDILSVLERILLQTLKRQILDVMVNQITNWIENGEEPRFVSNWSQFFGDIANGAAGEFIQNVAPFLCSPFSLQIRVGLLPVKRFGQNSPYTCTLDKVVANVENFYQDFRNGGWIAYDEASKLQNNYYGAMWLAWNGRDQFVASKISAANEEINANKGFLSVKLCRDNTTHEKVSEGSPNSTCETTTPGGYVGAALESTLSIPSNYIINAQDLGDYAAAIVNSLINRVIKEGVNGLRGLAGGQKQGAGQSYYSSVTDLPATVNKAGAGYAQIAQGTANELSNQMSSAIEYRTATKTALNTHLALENKIITDLQTLVNCSSNAATKDTRLAQLGTDRNDAQNLQAQIDQNNSAIEVAQNLSRELDSTPADKITTVFPPERAAMIAQLASEASLARARAEGDLATAQITYQTRETELQQNLILECPATVSALPK